MSNRGFLEDAATRHQIYVERFAGGSLKALAVFLLRALTMAKSRVADGLSAYGTARYDKQIAALHQDLLGVYSEMGEESLGQLRDFGVYEATYNATLLGKAVKAVVQLNTPSPQIVSAAALVQPMRIETGKRHAKLNIAGALDQYGVKKSAEIVGEIRMGSALGETSNQIAARLNSMGVLQRSQAEALTRTMTNHVATSARTQTLQENADILDGMRIIATLDSRTTILCASLDQDVIALTDPGPPFHWNCRTTVVPVLKAEYARDIPGSTRPSKGADGVAPVNSKTSYPEWLARQPASFQKDVLGRTRYELFSKGKLDIDKFVDNGRTLTLDQLREREPASFERAGLD